jgi:hypothetical protein
MIDAICGMALIGSTHIVPLDVPAAHSSSHHYEIGDAVDGVDYKLEQKS